MSASGFECKRETKVSPFLGVVVAVDKNDNGINDEDNNDANGDDNNSINKIGAARGGRSGVRIYSVLVLFLAPRAHPQDGMR